MKKIIAILASFLISVSAFADEGMWLPSLISQRIADMQAKGFKLGAEDIYSINQASLKDAVVLFGGGCTGELVSAEGLLFTNHHCGYSSIQKLSSVEHDYLRDGFWAMNRSQELHAEGLNVRFLERMEDVTGKILDGYVPGMTESERTELVARNSEAVRKAAVADGKGLRASVEALYYGNQYFLFVYRQYDDVRLVGAPPSSIGKFGGDTDNWMWPRHTGDFSIFRIYAGKDNMPAEYSEDNVPYCPKKYFKVSLGGVKEGDFTFIYGFPGSTREYIMSEGVRYISEISDPAKIDLRTKRLDILKRYMDSSQKIRIQYSSKYASISNAWKKWQGEAKGIDKMNTVAEKQAFEKRFIQWAKGGQYEGLVERIGGLYERLVPYDFAREYYTETVRAVELLSFASAWPRTSADAFFKDYHMAADKECFVALLNAFKDNVPDQFQPEYFKNGLASRGSVEAWADEIYGKSVFADEKAVASLSENADLESDPAREFAKEFAKWYSEKIVPVVSVINSELDLAYRDYMRGQMEFQKDKTFYPDANLTLRVAYGHIAGYSPSDGVYYHPSSTVKGIMEKDDPNIFDYNIPQRLRDIYAEGGHEDQPVCFIATNHTSGGNSGSPVINENGDLIGLNFDRVWEGTMSDIVFDPDFCRNICLDVRYLVFVVREIGGAGHILDEVEFTN